MSDQRRLAVVVSHPIQYYAPWFAYLHRHLGWPLRVFYLWDFGVADRTDPAFGRKVQWDIDLLQGYDHEFVPNVAQPPGTHRFGGLRNPQLNARLRAWSPDVVMVFGYGWWSLLHLALTWTACPLVLRGDTHLLAPPPTPSLRHRLRQWLLRRLFGRYAAFACVGTANRNYYAAHGVPPQRLHHVPHCVDNRRFTALTSDAAAAWRTRNQLPPDQFIVLFAGKFESKKRPDLLADAFQSAQLAATSLVFIGDGALKADLSQRTAARSDLLLLPFHNQSEMPAALSAADLLVLPSQGPEESWGLIVNEAMAAGTPALVSTHVGCAADLIVEGRTGWTFPAGDIDQLTARLVTAHRAILSDRDGFRQRVREHIAGYSYPTATQCLGTMLADIMTRPPSSPR